MSVKLRAFLLLPVILLVAPPAIAQEGGPPRENKPVLKPFAGAAVGQWMGVPVNRLMLGIEAIPGSRAQSIVHPSFTFVLEPGRTENGLGAHRFEAGVGITNRPSWFGIGAGLHVSYAMLVRETLKDNAFGQALSGNIGGFGLGVHANAEVAIALGGSIALTIGARAMIEVYDGGRGYQGGPLLGVRF